MSEENKLTKSQKEAILDGIRVDRDDIDNLSIIRVSFFKEPPRLCPNDIGEIEVQYDKFGHRAIYGFRVDGTVSCYID